MNSSVNVRTNIILREKSCDKKGFVRERPASCPFMTDNGGKRKNDLAENVYLLYFADVWTFTCKYHVCNWLKYS